LWLLTAVLLLAVSLCTLLVSPGLRSTLLGPDHSAVHRLTDGTEVTMALTVTSPIGKAEYDAWLTVRDGSWRKLSGRVFSDHGGFHVAHLYEMDDGSYLVAGSMGSLGFRTKPLKRIAGEQGYLQNRDRGLYFCDRAQGVLCGLRRQEIAREGCQRSRLFPGACYFGTFARHLGEDGRTYGFRKLADDWLDDPGG
jgi:hypothetical protein